MSLRISVSMVVPFQEVYNIVSDELFELVAMNPDILVY